MKQAILAFSGIILGFSNTAFAQENAVGQALDSYAKVAGAWYLNEKCGYLDTELLTDFENKVAYITNAMRADLGDGKILRLIQVSAKDTVDSDKYGNCESARPLFLSGFAHTVNWSTEIRKILGQELK